MGVFEILKKAFFACLNLVDFVTDTLVLLRLSCILDSDKGQPCTGSVSSTCQSHPWWTGIGFVILLVSTVYGCVAWVGPELTKYRGLHRTQRTWRRYLPIAGLYLIAFLQLSPFVDLFDLIKNRVDPEKKKASMRRDLRTKTLESGPQALFQSYILFSLGSQRELLNVLSISVSILSLSLGLVDYHMQPADADAGEEKVEDTQGPDINTSSVQGEVVGARQGETATEEAAANVTLDIAGPDLIGSSPEVKVKVVGASENDMNVSQKQLLRSSTMLPPQMDGRVKLDRPDSPIRMLYIGKLAAFAYLSSTWTLRCIAFAVNFSPSARGPGVAVATVFAVLLILQHPSLWAFIAARHEWYAWIIQTKCCRRNREHAAEDEKQQAEDEEQQAEDEEQQAEDEEQQAEPSSRQVHPLVRLIRVCCCPCVIVILICICIVFVIFWSLIWSLVVSVALVIVLLGLVALLLQAFTTSSQVVMDCASPSALRLAALRFLEYVCHGVILTTIARTACGELPILEIEVFFLLFGLNLASYVAYVMMQYKVQKLAECEKSLIETCSQIVSPCLERLARLYSCCSCSKLAECGKSLIETCSQIVSPCLERLARLYSCCSRSAKTLDTE